MIGESSDIRRPLQEKWDLRRMPGHIYVSVPKGWAQSYTKCTGVRIRNIEHDGGGKHTARYVHVCFWLASGVCCLVGSSNTNTAVVWRALRLHILVV